VSDSRVVADGGYSLVGYVTEYGGKIEWRENQTGETSVKGKLVTPSASVNNAVVLVAVGVPNPIGAIYDAGVAVGQMMRIVTSGPAQVLFVGNTTRAHLARSCHGTDAGGAAGKAISEAVPTSPFATDKHFMECGHVRESTTGGTLALVDLHFN